MSFAREWIVKAVRKPHQCSACRISIGTGESASRWAGMADGYFSSLYYHPDCRQAEIAFNQMVGGTWTEWYSLGDDLETADAPWLIAEFPAVAARLPWVAALTQER